MKISSCKDNTSFVQYLKDKKNKEIFLLCEDEWIHYLQDHFDLLRQNSNIVTLTEEVMQAYKYRIRDYLADKHRYTRNGIQAFLVTNKLHNDQEFLYDLQQVYVPTTQYIQELREQYAIVKVGDQKIDI